MKLIPLTKGQYAIVDDEDFTLLSRCKWTLHTGGTGKMYAYRKMDNRSVYMHRCILDVPIGYEVDHINGNGLDNRRINLRLCVHRQNQINVMPKKRTPNGSRFKGVWRNHRSQRWCASIRVHGKHFALGSFENEEDAAIVYNVAAQIYFGEFASLNLV